MPRIVRATLLVVLAGVLGVSGVQAATGARPDAGAGAGVATAQVRACGNADLTARYHATDAGAGHRYGRLALVNTSSTRCRTGGYGGLSYVGGGDGTQIGAAADRDPGTVRSYVVRPGHRLVSDVDAVVAADYPRKRCRPAAVDGFRVYVPDAEEAQYVPHATRGCTNRRIHLLGHGPYHRP